MVERYRSGDTVGYKKPPKHTRFAKGQSGNPAGRPKRDPATATTMMAEELQSTLTITENGRQWKTDKHGLLFKQALNQGIKGNLRPLVNYFKIREPLERLYKTPTRSHPRKRVDLSKLSLEEKQRMMKEMLADTKPLDEY